MSAIAQIELKLARYPQARRVLEESGEVRSIAVPPIDADGFAVRLTERPGQWTVEARRTVRYPQIGSFRPNRPPADGETTAP